MSLIFSMKKPLLMLILFGSMRVHHQFTMTTPPTAATDALFDTTSIVPKDHPVEILASLGNKFQTLAASIKDLTHVWTGENAANPARTQSYLAMELANILYLSEERIPAMIGKMLHNTFNAASQISLSTAGDIENFVKASQKSFKAFLTSKEKSNLERNAIVLKELLDNLRKIKGTSLLKANELNDINSRFLEIKKNVAFF